MNGLFCIVESTGTGVTIQAARRPWFDDGIIRWSGLVVGADHACNVFSENQTLLDAIAADARTKFSFPIDVNGTSMDYNDLRGIPPQMRGKIIAWCAQTYGAEFGQWVATSAKKRRFVAQEIMRKACGVPDADPLNGFGVFWTE